MIVPLTSTNVTNEENIEMGQIEPKHKNENTPENLGKSHMEA